MSLKTKANKVYDKKKHKKITYDKFLKNKKEHTK